MIPDKVEAIMQSLIDSGYDAYIVGGAVRDMVMHRTPMDWDIFTNASGEEILSIFPHGKIIGSEERRAKILTVIVDGIEVSQYRANGDRTKPGATLEKHLSTCDFTINSMAIDINENIIDPYFGIIDIQRKEIVCVGDTDARINEDKLRAFRAARFSVKYGFSITSYLFDVIYDTDISVLSVERIREEVLKIIVYPGGLNTLESLGLLEKVVPEFIPCWSMEGGRHHAETVDAHMYNAQDIACALTDNPTLVFACAFHDIGKPFTQEHKADGGTSFHNHETVGAEMLNNIMHRLKFSNVDTKYVTTLVAEHMFGWSNNKISNRAFVRHFKRLDDAGVSIEDYMVLLYSDNQANMKNKRIKFGDFIRENLLHKKYYELKFSKMPFRVNDLAISGRDLLDVGIPAGAEIGKVLNSIFDEVINGDLENERHVLMHRIKEGDLR